MDTKVLVSPQEYPERTVRLVVRLPKGYPSTLHLLACLAGVPPTEGELGRLVSLAVDRVLSGEEAA